MYIIDAKSKAYHLQYRAYFEVASNNV